MKSRLYEILEEYLSEEQLIVLNLDEYAEQFHFEANDDVEHSPGYVYAVHRTCKLS